MKYRWFRPILFLSLFILLVGFSLVGKAEAGPLAQLPTVAMPTVTSTPRGPYAVVNALTANDTQINVRAGPSALTEKVGVSATMANGCKSSILVWQGARHGYTAIMSRFLEEISPW